MMLGAHPQVTPEARAVAMSELVRLQKSLASAPTKTRWLRHI